MSKNIILGVTGSIAAYKAPDIVNKLKKEDMNVTVVMTESSENFITELTMQTISNNKVYTDVFDKQEESISHIDVVNKADLILIAPATANIIGKLANGICDDMLSTMCMVAKDKKIIIAPAMNTNMYENQILQKNINVLKGYGFKFIEPRESLLACNIYGKGALANVEDIVQVVKREVQ